jgi:hypothetical protein
MKKVFSVKDGNLVCSDNIVSVLDVNNRFVIASTYDFITDKIYTLPTTLIRTPKTDEELAEEYYKSFEDIKELRYSSFLAGRKSVKGEYSKENMISFAKWFQKEANAEIWFHYTVNDMFEYWFKVVYPKSIYPHTIEVEHDGENYLWNTLKAEY